MCILVRCSCSRGCVWVWLRRTHPSTRTSSRRQPLAMLGIGSLLQLVDLLALTLATLQVHGVPDERTNPLHHCYQGSADYGAIGGPCARAAWWPVAIDEHHL